jgi:ssDNA-binding Zn-finger/Zn-ribbon topoisomerase 1
MVQKNGRRGLFWGCVKFPACKGSADYDPKDDRVAAVLGPGPVWSPPVDTGGLDAPFCPDDPSEEVTAKADPVGNFFNSRTCPR